MLNKCSRYTLKKFIYTLEGRDVCRRKGLSGKVVFVFVFNTNWAFFSFREETLSAAKDWVGKLRASNSSTIPGVLLAAKVKRFDTESKIFKRIAKKRYKKKQFLNLFLL